MPYTCILNKLNLQWHILINITSDRYFDGAAKKEDF